MTREVYVLEEYSEGEGWYPARSSETRYEVECIHARWPDTTANPKRIVTYVPTTGWHPIATAPRDGTPVLYWSATLGHIVGNHPDGCVAGGWVFRDGRWYGSEDAGAQAATHWMPLPAPPHGGDTRMTPQEDAKDAEIAQLRAQVETDAHLRSIVELYRHDPLAMAEAITFLRGES